MRSHVKVIVRDIRLISYALINMHETGKALCWKAMMYTTVPWNKVKDCSNAKAIAIYIILCSSRASTSTTSAT